MIKHYVRFKLPDSDEMTLTFKNERLLNDFINGKSKECEIIDTYEDDITNVVEIKALMTNSSHYSKPSKSERRGII